MAGISDVSVDLDIIEALCESAEPLPNEPRDNLPHTPSAFPVSHDSFSPHQITTRTPAHSPPPAPLNWQRDGYSQSSGRRDRGEKPCGGESLLEVNMHGENHQNSKQISAAVTQTDL
ncbi:hypothetical protein IWQ62_004077, partial [Dispira parvispora]